MAKPALHVHFVAQDEGSVKALLPVFFNSGRWPGVKARFYAAKYALAYMRRRRLSCRAFPAPGRYPGRGDAPGLIVTGASMGGSIEKEAIASARSRGIASLTILDHDSKYWERFTADGGRDRSALPDMILAPDQQSREEMARLGFPRGRICVTGNPAFDGIRPRAGRKTGSPPSVLCVMQPRSANGRYRSDAAWLPVLMRLADKFSPPATVIVRPHPKEGAGSYRCLVRKGVKVNGSADIGALIAGSDVVIGRNSTALIEAALRGKTVISHEPGGRAFKRLPTERLGLSVYARSEQKLQELVRQALQLGRGTRRQGRIRYYSDGRNGQRAERCILALLKRARKRGSAKDAPPKRGHHV